MFYLSKLQFEIELLDDNAPTGYWGSRLRGGYGDMLWEECRGQTELFQKLFKPHKDLFDNPPVGPPLGGTGDLPAPFIIDPPSESENQIPKGGRMSFAFVALGPTVPAIEGVLRAYAHLGMVGFENRGRHARYRLLDVRDLLGGGRSIYIGEYFGQPLMRNLQHVIKEMVPLSIPDELMISFVTPVRIVRDKFPPIDDAQHGVGDRSVSRAARESRTKSPRAIRDFYDFVLVLADRIGGLWQVYGQEWPGPQGFRKWREDLLKASREVTLHNLELTKSTYMRYSREQHKFLPIEGFLGAMTVRGDLGPFLELLLMGEMVHIGEATAYGFGKYKLVY
jgi:hypothetical protein